MNYSQYKQGSFNPRFKDKYRGTYPILYRSSWELKLFMWLDNHPACKTWGSESAVVDYYIEGTHHKYYIDLTAVFKTKGGTKKFFIEVKPYRQTVPPVPSKRKKQETYLYECATYKKNMAKWEAASKFAASRGAQFIILTEKDLFKE